MPRPHLLKPNKLNEQPSKCIWFDTETTPHVRPDGVTEHHLKFGWAAYRRRDVKGYWYAPEWFRFETIVEFWDWVQSKATAKKKVYLFCHNTSFDLPVLATFDQLPQRGWILGCAIIDAPPTILDWRKGNSTLCFLDTLNFWRMPLRVLGESLGLAKLDMPDPDASKEIWDTYCRRDVEVIMRAVLSWFEFLTAHDFGGFAATLASQSLRTYRHRFMRHEIFIDGNEEASELAHAAMHGGRTECFYIGKLRESLTLLDVSSMYPWVMSTFPLPYHLMTVRSHVSKDELTELIQKFAIVAHIEVDLKEPYLPVKVEEKLVFPIGRIDGVFTTPELEHVIKHDRILRVFDVAIYKQAVLFTDYMTELYRERMRRTAAGDNVGAFFLKIMLNSFYGKWAQRGIVYAKSGDTPDKAIKSWVSINAQTMEVTRHRQFAGAIYTQCGEIDSYNGHVALAAHITAHARMELWKLILIAGRENVFYVDTDSLLVNSRGMERLNELVRSGSMGSLRIDGQYQSAEIRGSKDYTFGAVTRIKGVRSNAARLSQSRYQQESWSSLRGLLHAGALDHPTTRQVTKFLSRKYDKGIVGKDGRVTPHVLF